jgi:hypothetical protein
MKSLADIRQSMADRFMYATIEHHIKKEYFKKGITPTVEQVFQDINKDKLVRLHQAGYDDEDINGMITRAIGRQKCKG